ncbi:DUF6275 family protein [Faecalibaculum rodentium]|uniref:DUF6275 family protein n=1 Tax=Faecalibaculum rodentium TaxID=1702221 RepID=UPI0025A95D06|nr:DUF6275 family protein [Faecalibaculum rodentium]
MKTVNHEENARILITRSMEEPEDEYPISTKNFVLVWSCKTLQNWKGIFAFPALKLLFEVTYNGDKKEYYVDSYEKTENNAYKLDELEDEGK